MHAHCIKELLRRGKHLSKYIVRQWFVFLPKCLYPICYSLLHEMPKTLLTLYGYISMLYVIRYCLTHLKRAVGSQKSMHALGH